MATLTDAQAIDALFQYLKNVIYYPKQATLEPEHMPAAFVQLAQGLLYFGQSVIELRQLANDISRGLLDTNPVSSGNELAADCKALQSTLKHLTWQINHVAKGDYKQRVSYAGEFSEAINDMIKQLDERTAALNKELEVSRQRADELRESNNLFEAITQGIAQWIVVVDRKDYQWLYSNRVPAEALSDSNESAVMRQWVVEQIDRYESEAMSCPLGPFAPTEEVSFAELRAQADVEGRAGEAAGDGETSAGATVAAVGETSAGAAVAAGDEADGAGDGEVDAAGAVAVRQHFSFMRYPLTWHEEKALAFVFTDITAEKQRREKLESAAYYDMLTGTYSRLYGMNVLDEWLLRKAHFILAFVDMDNLKYVNDSFGHNEGDAYIMRVTQMLHAFDHKAVVSRLGGDEFMVLAQGWNKDDASQKLESIRDALVGESTEQYKRSISYGVVEVTPQNEYPSSLVLSMADEIMYKYKRSRKLERRATL